MSELDGLRGIAVLLVLLHHYCQQVPAFGQVDATFLRFANSTWIGVDLFFVLSGFLITGILLDAKGSSAYFRTFYIRRALRIFPIYYLLLIVLYVIAPVLDWSLRGRSINDAPWFFLYGANFLTAWHGWPDRPLAHLWSLAVEEHFYLVWPALVFILPLRVFGAVTVLLALGSVALRHWGLSHGWTPTEVYVLTHTRVDTLAVGGLLAALFRLRLIGLPRFRAGGALLAAFGSLLTWWWLWPTLGSDWTFWGGAQVTWGFLLLAITIAGGLAYVLSVDSHSIVRRFLRLSPLLALGRVSYALYLFHLPLEAFARHLGFHPASRVHPQTPSWPYLALYIAANLAVAYVAANLSWRFIEAPILRLKDRWSYR